MKMISIKISYEKNHGFQGKHFTFHMRACDMPAGALAHMTERWTQCVPFTYTLDQKTSSGASSTIPKESELPLQLPDVRSSRELLADEWFAAWAAWNEACYFRLHHILLPKQTSCFCDVIRCMSQYACSRLDDNDSGLRKVADEIPLILEIRGSCAHQTNEKESDV